MIRRISTVLVVSLILFAFLAMPAFASKAPVVKKRTGGISVNKAMQYSFPEEPRIIGEAVAEDDRPSLGTPSSSFYIDSPGRTFGSTWYDYQHNGSMGRMIEWGWDATNGLVVHMNFMKLPLVNERRHYRYEAFLPNVSTGIWSSPAGGTPAGGWNVQDDVDKYAGYVGIDVMNDNRAFVGGHENPGDGTYQPTFYMDGGVAAGSFSAREVRLPDALALCARVNAATEAIWPKFRYQESAQNVLHIFSQGSEEGAGSPQAVAYFRGIVTEIPGPPPRLDVVWDPCVVIDTIFDISQDIDASTSSQRVVLAWTANLPAPGDCVTCSNNEGGSQLNNDVYFMISDDLGAHWNDRVNVTMADSTQDGFRAYTDLSVLMSSANKVHIAWTGRYWPADPNASIYWNCRMFHWGEDLGYQDLPGGGPGGANVTPGRIRTVYDANWTIGTDDDQSQCTGGAWQMNIAKMTISECNDRLYILWTQFNDPPKGMTDDCAARAAGGTGDLTGAANGDLYVSVSSSMLGNLWDDHRNITQSYSGGCDPDGPGGECESDHWASMAQLGTDLTGNNWPSNDEGGDIHIDITPPPDVYSGSHYLDVQYINDVDAGGIVQDEGVWKNSPVKWFRLACVDPIPDPIFTPSWAKIGYPAWTAHGTQRDTSLTIENTGNVDLVYGPPGVIVQEDNGPEDWLAVSNFSGTVYSGVDNTETGTVHLNYNNVVNDPGTVVNLIGRLIFVHNGASSPDTLPISFWIADTLVEPTFDTLYTGPTAMIGTGIPLVVASNGNYGKEGVGKANLDYYASATMPDCDTNATVVIYEASPVIGWISGNDTIMNWSIFGDSYASPEGFKPVSHIPTGSGVDYDSFSSIFTSADTSVILERTWWAPHDPDSMQFMIQCLKVYTERAAGVSGLVIGEALDIDLASDSGSDNGSVIDGNRQAIYQFGGEYNDTTTDCQSEALRYSGIAFIEARQTANCPLIDEGEDPYGAYTASNVEWVYPAGGFVAAQLYANMVINEGYNVYNNTDPDSSLVDLHTVMTFQIDVSIDSGKYVKYYSVIASTHLTGETEIQQAIDKGKQWYRNHIQEPFPDPELCGCCLNGGDADRSGGLDVGDIVFLVGYLFQGQPDPPQCDREGDADGSGGLDVGDIVFLVSYLFQGSEIPPTCD